MTIPWTGRRAPTAAAGTPSLPERRPTMTELDYEPPADHTEETDEQRADRLETERDHAAGNHQDCGITCEAEVPSDMLRNGILAKGYPGTAAMLDELLRRTRETDRRHLEARRIELLRVNEKHAEELRRLAADRAALRERLDRVRAALRERLDRVRAEYDTLMAQVHGHNPGALAGRRDAVSRIRDVWRPIDEPEPAAAPPADRAAVLRWAANHLAGMDPVEAALAGQHAWQDAAKELRRQADETQQDDAEARPPRHSWRVETLDPLPNEWASGSRFISRESAVERYRTASSSAPLWKDGTPVQRRIVRETTSYTVEESAPAGAADDEQDGVHAALTADPTPLRWGLNDVMWGDDDTITVMLSGPTGEPYWLELDPERAAVLRQDLAGPDGEINALPHDYECNLGCDEAERDHAFTPDVPRALGLCATCGDSRVWHRSLANEAQQDGAAS